MRVDRSEEDSTGNGHTVLWRLRELERAVVKIVDWQAGMTREHQTLLDSAERIAGEMAAIRWVSVGTLITVFSGVVLWILTGSHH